MQIFDHLILGFLGIMTLRDLIAMSGLFPRNKKYSFLIYNNYDNYIIKETLKSVGIEKRDIMNTIYEKGLNYGGDIGIKNLIQIISQYLIKVKGNVQYGNNPVITTKYYIATVEATYSDNKDYLSWMCHLLGDLIINNLKKNNYMNRPDFIITPKGGNTNLGRAYAYSTNALFITSKYRSLKSSYVMFNPGEPEFELKTNYEGAWELIKKAESLEQGKKLFGVVVTCTTATGEQIVETMKSFNSFVKRMNLPIEPVKYAFTLYRAIDNNELNIDVKFEQLNYALYRYFDLSENNKELIYNKKEKREYLDVHKAEDIIIMNQIIGKLSLLQ